MPASAVSVQASSCGPVGRGLALASMAHGWARYRPKIVVAHSRRTARGFGTGLAVVGAYVLAGELVGRAQRASGIATVPGNCGDSASSSMAAATVARLTQR